MDPRQAFLGGAELKSQGIPILLLGSVLLSSGCATYQPKVPADPFEPAARRKANSLSAEVKAKILALDAERVTEQDVRELLSQAPAPQIINIHGGLMPIKARMISFSKFLVGMGYPEVSIRNPRTSSYTYGYYDRSEKLAGTIAWYYEQDGLRPMIMGHSLGGIQAVRTLHKLAGDSAERLAVWNPVTGREEPRYEITDPLAGTNRPVVGLQVSYATATVSGGLGRIVPNEWDMNATLREIPDSVEEFNGFQKGLDLLGGDFLGYGSSNDYHATGRAIVRNVRLPAVASHSTIPAAGSLLQSEDARDWIENYRPGDEDSPGLNLSSGSRRARILWAAVVWYGIKKHWVLELQRLIRATSPQNHGD